MKRIAIGLILISLTGCVSVPPPMSLAQAEYACSTVEFAGQGGCIRSQLDSNYPAWHSNREGDLADIYIAWLEAAGARVGEGSMRQEDARLGAATLKSRLMEISAQRTATATAAISAQMLAGLALLNEGAPHPLPSNTISCSSLQMGYVLNTTCR